MFFNSKCNCFWKLFSKCTNCSDNIIKLPKGHIGVINGLNGYIVAEQGDVLLICKKGDSSSLIRKYVNEVGIRYGEEFTCLVIDQRSEVLRGEELLGTLLQVGG